MIYLAPHPIRNALINEKIYDVDCDGIPFAFAILSVLDKNFLAKQIDCGIRRKMHLPSGIIPIGYRISDEV